MNGTIQVQGNSLYDIIDDMADEELMNQVAITKGEEEQECTEEQTSDGGEKLKKEKEDDKANTKEKGKLIDKEKSKVGNVSSNLT